MKIPDTSWDWAVELTRLFLSKPARLQHLLERLPSFLDGSPRRSCQRLVYGSIRHLGLIEKGLETFIKKKPRPELQARLVVASYELLAMPERASQIVDHAVTQVGQRLSAPERSLANAVLRKMAGFLSQQMESSASDVPELSVRYSHPEWLVERCVKGFGMEDTRQFLQWNQREPDQYVFTPAHSETNLDSIDGIFPSRWADYGLVQTPDWSLVAARLNKGDIYLQNPGAGHVCRLIDEVFQGGRVLDLCAAPGGKSLMLEKKLRDRLDALFAVDLPGPRFERMGDNFARCRSTKITSIASDLRSLDESLGRFEAVLLDAPCSNTGVLQRKADVKWRLTPARMKELPVLQLELLRSASGYVIDNGILAYSTCSIDASENEDVIAAFLNSDSGSAFSLEKESVNLPWRQDHDGAGAFILRKSGSP